MMAPRAGYRSTLALLAGVVLAVVSAVPAMAADPAPTVAGTEPSDGATGVAVDTAIGISFSEPVALASGWFTIVCAKTGAHTALEIGGGSTFVLIPDASFGSHEVCTVTVLADHVTDLDGTPDAMAADFTFQFTTETLDVPDDAPTVVATGPADGATNVDLGSNVSVTFSEPVDVAAGWYTIACDTSGNHAATVSGGPTSFGLDPATNFASHESCTVTVHHAAVTDQDTQDPPDAMAADFTFGFTTKTVNAPPSVEAGGPYTVVEGGSTTVSATGHDPDGDALSYAWDLDGNGSFETPGRTVTFSAAGLSAPATRTIHVKATDPGGLSGTAAATVHVVWDYSAQPGGGDDKPTGGSTVQVRFSLNGDQGDDIFRSGYPSSAWYPCGSVPSAGAAAAISTGGPGLKFNRGQDEYTLQWKTDKSWRGTCRVLVLGLQDGTSHAIPFQFK